MKKYLLSELSESEVRWSMSYVGLSWAAELGNGAIQTITGNISIAISSKKSFYVLEFLFKINLLNRNN